MKDSGELSRPSTTCGCLRSIREWDQERPEENRAGVMVNSAEEPFKEEVVSGWPSAPEKSREERPSVISENIFVEESRRREPPLSCWW